MLVNSIRSANMISGCFELAAKVERRPSGGQPFYPLKKF
jgi:hypothetical protein